MPESERSFILFTEDGIADGGQADKLARLETRLAQPGAKLLLHLHGGLVDEKSGNDGATRLSGAGPNSWQIGDDWTQVYVVWRTGPFETIRTNWTDLAHDDRFYQILLTKLIRFIARRLGIPAPEGARSVGEHFDLSEAEIRKRIQGHGTEAQRRNPFGEVEPHLQDEEMGIARAAVIDPRSDAVLARDFEIELAADREFQKVVADIDNAANDGLPGRAVLLPGDAEQGLKMLRRMSPKIRAEVGPVDSLAERSARGPVSVGIFLVKHAGTVAWRCIKRFRNKRDHGFHATIVEELCREIYGDFVGSKVWGMMVKDTADHFEQEGLGTALLAMIGRVPAPDRFILSGHSAGSIWASRMLLRMEAMGLRRKLKLLLLAPAVRQDLFAEVLTKAGRCIESCHMFTMTDELERKDAVLGHDKGYIYPSSLLYCVSGMFEEQEARAYTDAPLVGMRRFASAGWLEPAETLNEEAISAFFGTAPNSLVTSPTPGICEADCHGCFDDEPKTLASAAATF